MKIVLDPSYAQNRGPELFTNGHHNRDNSLDEFIRLTEVYGDQIETPDKNGNVRHQDFCYISLGALATGWRHFDRLDAFCLLEPPLIASQQYGDLEEILNKFRDVYLFGGANALHYKHKFNCKAEVHPAYFPVPWRSIGANVKFHERKNAAAIIASNRSPKTAKNQLYSERIKAVLHSTERFPVDLYGAGWDKMLRLHSLAHPTFVLNAGALQRRYRGPVLSKISTLSEYRFGLVLENSIHTGYVTEKIFDCMAAGAVPIYLGAPDIDQFVDPSCFINVRRFDGWKSVFSYAASMSESVWSTCIENIAKEFSGPRVIRHNDFLLNMVERATAIRTPQEQG